VKKSVKEIDYHCDVLDFMGLNQEAKIQIHIGGVYDDKNESINRFIKNYNRLKLKIKKRLVIENDHISYSLKDCLSVNKRIKIPIVFDVFHHECLNNKEDIFKAIKMASETWSKKDGKLMVDYSNQEEQKRKGVHRETINLDYFKSFLSEIKNIDCDIMLEIKDKEKSAIKVINLLKNKK
jgi:UV DNA damage endonuclease